MRVLTALAFAVALAGCKPALGPTSAPATFPAPKADTPEYLGLPWTEGAANRWLKGLTDEDVERLLGKPQRVDRDPDAGAGDRTLWLFTEKKWMKPNPKYPAHKELTGMIVVLRKGVVVEVQRIDP